MKMWVKLAAMGTAVLAFAVPSGTAFAHPNAAKPKVGQTCNPKSKTKPPKGMKCVKGKNGKYTYQM